MLIGDWRLDDLLSEARQRNEQTDVVVILIEATVLSDLAAAGEDDTGVRLEDDIRRPWIVAGGIELLLE